MKIWGIEINLSIKSLRRNYMAPTPYKLRLLADFVLGLQVLISGAITISTLTANQKIWSMLIVNVVAATFIFITKFISESKKKRT